MKQRHRGRGFLIAAVLCIIVGVVYGSINLQANALFSLLIVGVGLVFLVLGVSWLCRPKAGKILRRCLIIAIIALLCGFGIMEGFIISAGQGDYQGEPDVIIVPGAALLPDGTPGLTLETRLAAALEQLERYPDCIVVVSGGQGADEANTEASAMAQWLLEQGVSESHILQETASRDTSHNITFSLDLLESKGYDLDTIHLLIVSNDYHLFRVNLLAERRCGMVSTLGVPAVTVASMVYNYTREVFAIVKEVLFQ